jgi:pimeloyl-ACP methyl ester carboxylesterase
VVAPDLPGLGESEVRAGRLDAGVAVAWLGNLLAQTCAEPPTLIGHSLGGALAARLAIEHGDQVGRIVLVDSGSLGRFRPAPGVIGALLRYGARPSSASRDRFLRQVLVNLERTRAEWGDRWAALEAYDLDQASRPSVDAATRQLLLRIGVRRIPPDRLRKISVPVALIWGRADRLMRFRIAEKASDQFGWPLYPLDDCGHGPHIERPEAFLEALRAATA